VTTTLLCQALDESIASEPLTLADLGDMDAAFATNAATGVRAVSSVDGTKWASEDHPALEELRAQYAEIPSETV
jgi:branched-subunit amino acid aminotransferase/4-amino-4-deoxychorismate lyase